VRAGRVPTSKLKKRTAELLITTCPTERGSPLLPTRKIAFTDLPYEREKTGKIGHKNLEEKREEDENGVTCSEGALLTKSITESEEEEVETCYDWTKRPGRDGLGRWRRERREDRRTTDFLVEIHDTGGLRNRKDPAQRETRKKKVELREHKEKTQRKQPKREAEDEAKDFNQFLSRPITNLTATEDKKRPYRRY